VAASPGAGKVSVDEDAGLWQPYMSVKAPAQHSGGGFCIDYGMSAFLMLSLQPEYSTLCIGIQYMFDYPVLDFLT
jgi:hypothetical protein